jgi:hypothetical protein
MDTTPAGADTSDIADRDDDVDHAGDDATPRCADEHWCAVRSARLCAGLDIVAGPERYLRREPHDE